MSKLKHKWIYFVPFAVCCALFFVFYFRLGVETSHIPSALLNKKIPDIRLPSLFEDQAPLEMGAQSLFLKDKKIIILNVFASWCVPCKAEHPFITRLSE
ncbi:MAG: hypothetical protein AAF403_08815, partial [Pseudomonadota bacterium]